MAVKLIELLLLQNVRYCIRSEEWRQRSCDHTCDSAGKRSGLDNKKHSGKVQQKLSLVNPWQRVVDKTLIWPQGGLTPCDLSHTMSTLLLIRGDQWSLAQRQLAVMQPDVSSDKTWPHQTAMKWVIKACLSKLIYCMLFISMSQTPFICQM